MDAQLHHADHLVPHRLFKAPLVGDALLLRRLHRCGCAALGSCAGACGGSGSSCAAAAGQQQRRSQNHSSKTFVFHGCLLLSFIVGGVLWCTHDIGRPVGLALNIRHGDADVEHVHFLAPHYIGARGIIEVSFQLIHQGLELGLIGRVGPVQIVAFLFVIIQLDAIAVVVDAPDEAGGASAPSIAALVKASHIPST